MSPRYSRLYFYFIDHTVQQCEPGVKDQVTEPAQPSQGLRAGGARLVWCGVLGYGRWATIVFQPHIMMNNDP